MGYFHGVFILIRHSEFGIISGRRSFGDRIFFGKADFCREFLWLISNTR